MKGVRKSYREGSEQVQALKGIDLTVPAGQFLCIMGPCGSGKSTLMRLVAGREAPSRGSIVIGDVRIDARERARRFLRLNACMIGHLFDLSAPLTVEENVALPLLLEHDRHKDLEDRIESTLQQLSLVDLRGRMASTLSEGEIQRVALGRALVVRPGLVLADSPTDSLDGRSAEEVLTLLRRGPDEHGATLIVATHDIRSASYADRVIVMRDGMIADDVPAHRANFGAF